MKGKGSCLQRDQCCHTSKRRETRSWKRLEIGSHVQKRVITDALTSENEGKVFEKMSEMTEMFPPNHLGVQGIAGIGLLPATDGIMLRENKIKTELLNSYFTSSSFNSNQLKTFLEKLKQTLVGSTKAQMKGQAC